MKNKKAQKEGFRVKMPAHSLVNKEIVEELDQLFDMCPPAMLKKSVSHIFWAYLCNTDPECYSQDMKEIATDFHCLLQFLETAAKQEENTG